MVRHHIRWKNAPAARRFSHLASRKWPVLRSHHPHLAEPSSVGGKSVIPTKGRRHANCFAPKHEVNKGSRRKPLNPNTFIVIKVNLWNPRYFFRQKNKRSLQELSGKRVYGSFQNSFQKKISSKSPRRGKVELRKYWLH